MSSKQTFLLLKVFSLNKEAHPKILGVTLLKELVRLARHMR
jgi:hypothetical protein